MSPDQELLSSENNMHYDVVSEPELPNNNHIAINAELFPDHNSIHNEVFVDQFFDEGKNAHNL